MAEVAVLDVLLHGKAIGTLTRLPGDRVMFAWRRSTGRREEFALFSETRKQIAKRGWAVVSALYSTESP